MVDLGREGATMGNEQAAGESGVLFREIPTVSPERRRYDYKSIKTLTYVVVGVIAAKIALLVVKLFGLASQWRLLDQMRGLTSAGRETMLEASRANDQLV